MMVDRSMVDSTMEVLTSSVEETLLLKLLLQKEFLQRLKLVSSFSFSLSL